MPYIREYEILQTGIDTFDIEYREFGKVTTTIHGLTLDQCCQVEDVLSTVAKSIIRD